MARPKTIGPRAAEPRPADVPRPAEGLEERRSQFEALALPLADLLYAAALRLAGNPAKAEDLVQETYVRAWQNFDRFQLGTNFKAWVFQIMVFVNQNERRSAKSREKPTDFSDSDFLADRPLKDEAAARGPQPDWQALYPDLVDDRFKRALDGLHPDQRTVLLLTSLGELSYEECAQALGIPIGTVMSRLFRARKHLQTELLTYAREQGLLKTAR
jgi:RNA polymerase sigma-70 factor (ECF subfamily)